VRGGHLEVGKLLRRLGLAASLALSFFHKVRGVPVTARPVAEHEGHLRDVVRHAVHILAVLRVHPDFFPALGECENVAVQLAV